MAQNNLQDIIKIIEERVQKAFSLTQETIYQQIKENIDAYYQERVFKRQDGTVTNIPYMYDRTEQFLNSLVKIDVVNDSGFIWCRVEIDTGELEYFQSGSTVINMINEGFHAKKDLSDSNYDTPYDIESNIHFWDDAIEALGGTDGIYSILQDNLIKCNVPIKKK